jgi:hypothetical protein
MQGAVEDGEVISRGDEGPQVEGDVAKHLEDTVPHLDWRPLTHVGQDAFASSSAGRPSEAVHRLTARDRPPWWQMSQQRVQSGGGHRWCTVDVVRCALGLPGDGIGLVVALLKAPIPMSWVSPPRSGRG